MTNSHTISFR